MGMMNAAVLDLFDFIENNEKVSLNVARIIFYQLCFGLFNMHKIGVCHGDIKDENILVAKDFYVYFIDFGAVKLGDGMVPSSEFKGTPEYSAPEIIKNEFYCPKKADIWSLGLVLVIGC
jgi:serine/threonine protein kinase